MDEHHDDYIRLVKERLSAYLELGVTADDYIHEIENIYGDVFSDSIRKFYKRMVAEMPEVPKEKLSGMMMEHIKNWDEILEEQISHFSAFSENLFKVPSNIVLEQNAKVHEAIVNYSVKDDSKMEKMIEELNKRIERKQAYVNVLTVQLKKLEIEKSLL